jgi:acyl-CoA thioesterase II
MSGAAEVVKMLSLRSVGEQQYEADNLAGPAPVVFGGQILAQAVVAACTTVPDKELKNLHTVFARGGAPDRPLKFDVQVIQQGRSFASLTIAIRQGDRLCAQSTALLHDPEPDLIRYEAKPPDVTAPVDTAGRPGSHDWWEVRVVDDVDLYDPDAVGPPRLDVWSRFIGAPDLPFAGPALLAFASDGFLIATAMRPHKGIGQSMSHRTISTSVVAQTLSFHGRFDADEWLLLHHVSPHAGRGRSFGRADVFAEDGRLVASYAQENMIRNIPEGHGGPGDGSRAKY